MPTYDKAFYEQQMDGSLRSARAVVPLVTRLINPKSVVDIGCGVGAWLSVYKQHGVEQILGIDGDYVERDMLFINASDFLPKNLSKSFHVGKKFDLVQSLEVAEHVDKSCARVFVENLVGLGDVILFSAAIPFQLGTDHINEQFLDYWADLFREHDYHPIDCIRPKIWANKDVEVWYRQNIVLFARMDHISASNALREEYEKTGQPVLSRVHPELYSVRITMLLKVLLDSAVQHHKNGNLPAAENLYKLILHHSPHSSEVWSLYGQLAAQVKNFDVALNHLNQTIKINPTVPAYYSSLGQIYSALGKTDKAQENFNRAVGLNLATQRTPTPGARP